MSRAIIKDVLIANEVVGKEKIKALAVTHYLRPEAVDGTLSWVRAHATPGSAIIFDYQDRAELPQTQIRRGHIFALLTRFTGERLDFGILHSQIEDFMTQRGFTHVVDVNAEKILHKLRWHRKHLRQMHQPART